MIDPTIQRLVKARERLGLSQREAARRAGISRTWLQDLEAGRLDNPGLKTIRRLADVLGVRVGAN